MKRILLNLIVWFIPFSLMAQSTSKPWAFWYWMYGAVSKPGIHADLQGMKDIGLNGCYLMPIRGTQDRPEFHGQANQLSPDFWNRVDYAFQQADSLGLEMGIHVCDGFALGGGPWVTPDESMQKVVWTDTILSGKLIGKILKRPESYKGYEKDIVTLAFPVKARQRIVEVHLSSVTSSSIKMGGDMKRIDKGAFLAKDSGYILFDWGKVQTVRSITIIPSGNNIQCQRLKMMSSDDGVHFNEVKQLEPARQGWESYGFGFTYSLPPVTARYFRFDWTPAGTEPGSEDLDAAKWRPVFKLNDLILSSEPKINQWQGKAANMWLVAPETTAEEVPDQDCLNVKDEVRLVMKGDTIVSCFPQIRATKTSKWRVLRFGHTSTGMMNSTGGGGKGLEIDKFNTDATNRLFDNWYKRFLDRPHSRVVKIFHIDSWECGSQNWGRNFADEFNSRRGYDLLPFMPLYAGIPMMSASQSEHVLRDIRLTDNDLVNDYFFKILETRAHVYGKLVSHESIAPTFVADGIQHYSSADIPMGEFWLNSPTHDKPSDMLDAVSGAHLYGRNIVQAEGPTEVRGVWNETPAMVKPLIDRNFALGMNRLVFHVDAHNPWMDRKPGMTLDGIGFFFQRDNTWYPEASGLVSYVTRCQRILQQGTPVVDIAVFTGEEMPRRSITPDRIVPMLPGVFGRQRVKCEQKRLTNVGQPIEESPVGVYHSAGIMNLKEWINPLHGYCYDSMNPDALPNDIQIEDSCLVTPGGIHYRILVLPGKRPMDPCYHGLSATVNRRIEDCRKSGVIIIDRPYKNSEFSSLGVNRDVILPEQIAYTHRTTDSTEIYFLANQEDSVRNFTASFRVCHAQPELYDALSDETYLPDFWKIDGQRTNVAIHLPSEGSIFVIFKKVKGMVSLSESNSDLLPLKVLKKSVPVSSTWNICFTATGKNINTKNLFDWSQSLDEKIKYYSGSAFYTTSFSYKGKKGKKVELSLGTLKDVARVYVNGIDCGVAWTAPYTVNISKAVHHGKNQLQIKVDNTWVNALNGAAKGKAPYNGIWTNAKYRMKNKQLLVAGLLGPVVIKY